MVSMVMKNCETHGSKVKLTYNNPEVLTNILGIPTKQWINYQTYLARLTYTYNACTAPREGWQGE